MYNRRRTGWARCGFAGYFRQSTLDEGFWEDHWITEHWDGQRWVRSDPQLDSVQLEHIRVDPDDLPAQGFLTAAEAWQAYRGGRVDPNRFGVPEAFGAWFIAASVIRDLAALNKVEMLPWDYWGAMKDWDFDDDAVDVPLVDRLAVVGPDGVRAAWQGAPELWVPDDLGEVRSVR